MPKLSKAELFKPMSADELQRLLDSLIEQGLHPVWLNWRTEHTPGGIEADIRKARQYNIPASPVTCASLKEIANDPSVIAEGLRRSQWLRETKHRTYDPFKEEWIEC